MVTEALRAIATDIVAGDLYRQHVAGAVADEGSAGVGEIAGNVLLYCADLCEYVRKTGGVDAWACKPKHRSIQ